MMNNLKTKILFLIVLLLGSPSVSYSRFKIREAIVRFCENTFANKVRKSARTNINYLNQMIPHFEGDPVLLRHLEEFHADVMPFLTGERNSLSDLLSIQKKFNRLISTWLFWRSTETGSIFFDVQISEGIRRKLQKWGEDSLGRSLNEQETQALKEAYSYNVKRTDIRLDVQFFTKQKILREAGFSEREMDQLGRKLTLRGRKTIVLEIPQIASIEAALRAQGYEPDHIKGMDETKELMVAGKQLLDKLDETDIYTAHIPYLAQKLKQYIAYMEKGISNSTQRERFERLKEYVEILIEEEGVTYDKYLAVSLRSAHILLEGDIPISFQSLLRLFPKRIVMPTIAGLIGYMSLSETRSEKVESIALVRKNKFVDGVEMTPTGVIYHDMAHILDSDRTDKIFYNGLKKLRGKLPAKIIQNAVLAYHLLTHESSAKVTFTNKLLEITVHNLRFELLSNFFPTTSKKSKEEREEKVDFEVWKQKAQVIIDDFIYVFHEINQRTVN